MTPEHWRHVKELFYSALEQAPDERAAFLAEACSEDKTLRAEVESLLASHDEDGSLEGLPGAALAAQFVAENEGLWEGRRIGPYKILRQIGHGGMGAVFLAVRADDQYQKRVALKLVKHGMDSQSILRRFRQERQILASLGGADRRDIARWCRNDGMAGSCSQVRTVQG
jgi:eukaryotic-like serine/threonine-protein kinase